jgi:hypothetical protein
MLPSVDVYCVVFDAVVFDAVVSVMSVITPPVKIGRDFSSCVYIPYFQKTVGFIRND